MIKFDENAGCRQLHQLLPQTLRIASIKIPLILICGCYVLLVSVTLLPFVW